MGTCSAGVAAELPVTMHGLQPVIEGSMNGIEARFIADSGAFYSMLTDDSVQKYQLSTRPLPYGFAVQGVGGRQWVSLATAKDFELVGLHGGVLHNAEFLVGGAGFGSGTSGLIGQNILGYADTEYDLANGVIRMIRVTGCEGRSLAYWSGSRPVVELKISARSPQQPHILATAKLNGKEIRLLLDTGAGTSMLTKHAAAKLGVTPQTSGVVSGGATSGIGGGMVDTWIAPFSTLDFGDEQIQNIKVRFGDFEFPAMDMLLGADFFLSHRIYVANSQHKLYFTYNGGPVFDLTVRGENKPVPEAPAQQTNERAAPGTPESTPADAPGYRRRAAASVARGDYQSAFGDLDHAVQLDPSDPENYYQRALLRLQNKESGPALADIDQAIKLKPDYVQALALRGGMRMRNNDEAGASADFAEALKLAPRDSDLAYRIASTYDHAGRTQDAIARYDQWITAFPGDRRTPAVLNDRCWARAMLGTDLGLALKDCDDAVRLAPHSSSILDSRAFVRLRRGDLDDAMKDYKAALHLRPKNASALYGLGLVEARKGMKAESARDIQSALAVQADIADEFTRAGVTP
jgi:tetratricopeptide (TPR) repeat protein